MAAKPPKTALEPPKLGSRSARTWTIPSIAARVPFSALAFLGAHKSHEFIKLRLSNLIIMAEPTQRRSNRSRKPIVHFDDQIAESIGPSKPPKPPKGPANPTKPTVKPIAKPTAKPSISIEPSIPDPIEQLCSQTEELDIEEDPKAKKKAKAVEIARLKELSLKGVMEEAKPLKDVQFEPFNPGHHREPKVNIPSNIDPTDPLALLDLVKIYRWSI
jgi:hypothetical protein